MLSIYYRFMFVTYSGRTVVVHFQRTNWNVDLTHTKRINIVVNPGHPLDIRVLSGATNEGIVRVEGAATMGQNQVLVDHRL